MNISKALSTLGRATTDPSSLARGTSEGASPLDDIDENPLGISDKGAEEAKEWDEDLTTRGQEGPKHVGHYAADVIRSPLAALGGLAESAWDAADWITGDDMLPDWDRGHGSWGENWFDKSATLPGGLVEGFLQFATFFIPGTWALGAAKTAKAAKAATLAAKGAKGGAAKQAGQLVANNVVKGKKNFDTKQMKLLKGLKKNSRAFAEVSAIGAVSDLMAFKGQEMRLSNLLTKMGGDDSPDLIKWLAHDPNAPEEWHSEVLGRLKNMIEGFFVGSALVGGVAAGKGLFKLMNRHPAAARNAQERAQNGEQPNPAEDAAKAIKDNPVTEEEAKALIQTKFQLERRAENEGIPQSVKDRAAEQSSPFQPWQKRIDPVLRPKTSGRSTYANEASARKAVEKIHKKDPDEYTYLPDEDGGVVPVLTEELERLGLARPRSAEELAGIDREADILGESLYRLEGEAETHVPFLETDVFEFAGTKPGGYGGIMDPTKGKKKHPAEYDGYEEGMFGNPRDLFGKTSVHNKVFNQEGGGRGPDEVAQELAGAGLIPGKDRETVTTDDLWNILGKLYKADAEFKGLAKKQKERKQQLDLAERQRHPDVEKDLTYKKFKETQEHARKLEGDEGLEPSPEFWWQKPREEPEGPAAVASTPNTVPQRPGPYGIAPRHKNYAAQSEWDAKYKATHNADGTPKEGEGAVRWVSDETMKQRNDTRFDWAGEDRRILEGREGAPIIALRKAEARRNQIREGWQKEDAEAGVIDPHDQPTTNWDEFMKERPLTSTERAELQKAADAGSQFAQRSGIKPRKPETETGPVEGVARAEEGVAPKEAPPGRDEPSSEPKSWNEDELDNFLKSRDILPTHMVRDQKVRVTEDLLKGKITESQIATLKEAAEKILKEAGGWDKTNPRAVYSGARHAGDQAELASTFMVIAAAALKKTRAEAPPRSATQQVKLEYQQHQAREAQEMADLMSGAIGGEPRRLNLEHFEGRADELAMFRADQMALFDGFVDAGRHVSEKFHKFEKAVDESATKGLDAVEKARAELYSAMDYHLNVHKLLSRFGTEYSQGMSLRYLMFHGDTYTGSFRPVPIRKIGFDTPTEFALKSEFAARDALHHGFRGGKSEKAVMKSIRKAVAHDDPIERATALGKLLPSERNLMAMTQEWYLNALLGSPVTWAVNLTSNFAVMALGHFKLTTGALLTGNKDLLKANISAMFDIQNFVEALKFAKLSLKTGESRSVSGHTAYHDNRIDLSGHFKAEKLGVPKQRRVTDKEGNVTMEPNGYYEAIEFLGATIRHPQRIMLAGDEFFKQWNFRARTKTMLGMEAYEKGITDPKAWAKHVEEGFEGLITKEGRFRNEGNVMKEATAQAEKRGLVGRERTTEISKYMDRHYRNNDIILEGPEGKLYDRNKFYERQALVEDGTDWALVQTFTNNPRNALTRNLSKLATFSPWLTFVIPFVRTPANILTYALSHTVPIGRPTRIQKAGVAGALQRKKVAPTEAELAPLRELYEDMGTATPQADAMARKYHDLLRRGNSVEAAEYLGRLATAGMAVGGIFMYVEGIKENITGSSPEGGPDREAWKIAGKQPYSIKMGDKWVSYQRMDPFATMLGIFVDIVHGFDRARLKERGIFGGEDDIEENASVFKKVVGVMALSMANNLTKKSYVENLASFFDLLRRPTQTGPQLGGNILGGFVPNALNVSQNIYQEDPAILESRKLLDKFMQKLGPLRPNIGETLLTTGKPMPQRNFLGEIRRKQNLGGLKGLAPFFSSDVSIDSVDLELEALQQGRANMSPMLTVDGSRRLNLRDYIDASGNTAFDRMQELSSAGDTSIRGSKTLRQALRMLIESRGYQSLPDINDNNLGPDHPRNKAISGVIGTYRARAKRQIFKEFPELKADYVRMLQANPY